MYICIVLNPKKYMLLEKIPNLEDAFQADRLPVIQFLRDVKTTQGMIYDKASVASFFILKNLKGFCLVKKNIDNPLYERIDKYFSDEIECRRAAEEWILFWIEDQIEVITEKVSMTDIALRRIKIQKKTRRTFGQNRIFHGTFAPKKNE
jgi:hypothetical protein